MTNNELILSIARAMIDNLDSDAILDMHADLRRRMTDDDYSTLSDALELCPIHNCDYRICADDDNPECAHLRH